MGSPLLAEGTYFSSSWLMRANRSLLSLSVIAGGAMFVIGEFDGMGCLCCGL